MSTFLKRILQYLDQFLRINSLTRTSDRMRARAIYTIAFIFVISQSANLIFLTYSYGQWTPDHNIALAVIGSTSATILALRYCKVFVLYAVFISFLIFAGIAASATQQFTGINSALLPYLVLGTVLNGFISGWRSVLIYGVAAIVFSWFLYGISMGAPAGALFDPQYFNVRMEQRTIQASIILTITSLIVSIASHQMHSAFFMLEEKINEIEVASGQRSLFLANMSHEIRTPLNGILGFCELLAKTSLNKEQAQYADVVCKSADSLLAIVSDSLEIAKIDAGKFEVAAEEFNLHETIHAVVDLYQPSAIKKGLLLATQYPDTLTKTFIGDEAKIRKILNLLLSNAVQFTDDGAVHVTVSRKYDVTSDQTIFISVIDTGIGIEASKHNEIFERFCQIDHTLTRRTDGTGLGLALCKEIVDHMGATIQVESELGNGAKFTVALKLKNSVEPTVKTPAITPSIATIVPKLPPRNVEIETVCVSHIDSAA